MEKPPITEQDIKLIALEEGLRSAITLDNLRLDMLNRAVQWLEEETGLETYEIRQEIISQKAGQVKRSLDTIKAVRHLLQDDGRN